MSVRVCLCVTKVSQSVVPQLPPTLFYESGFLVAWSFSKARLADHQDPDTSILYLPRAEITSVYQISHVGSGDKTQVDMKYV